MRTEFAQQPALRFAVGDEVEFLHELETESEWKLGKVVELHYRERDFDISFSAPYCLQLLDDSDSTDQPPVYTWAKADIDRYVRKVGVRSIEGTRYQARLDAKVAELAQVYYSKEYIENICIAIAQDKEFVDMCQSVWQVELSEATLGMYRTLVLYRQPLIRTDTGYRLPLAEEVIAAFKGFFDPAYLTGGPVPSAVGEDIYSRRTRTIVLCIFRGMISVRFGGIDDLDIQGLLLQSIRNFFSMLPQPLDPSAPYASVLTQGCDFTVPTELSEAISKASSLSDLEFLHMRAANQYADFCSESSKLGHYVLAWLNVHTCLENPNARAACECPFVYFFVTYCLDQGLGVPKLALVLYDRMNMQLSREFIRCANPTCEHNKLDKSTGKVKFKNCSRCKAVIYCSRECQTAHYPEHKRLCREHVTGGEGS